MFIHLRIIVSGKVQGVFYRAATKEKALELGITGLVKNLSDGRVYIEAEGHVDVLQTFRAWCAIGPPRAVVSDVDIIEEPMCEYQDFRIIR